MLQPYRDYIYSLLVGRKFRFYARCVAPVDVTGTVVDIERHNNENIYIIYNGERNVKVAENTPNLMIESL